MLSPVDFFAFLSLPPLPFWVPEHKAINEAPKTKPGGPPLPLVKSAGRTYLTIYYLIKEISQTAEGISVFVSGRFSQHDANGPTGSCVVLGPHHCFLALFVGPKGTPRDFPADPLPPLITAIKAETPLSLFIPFLFPFFLLFRRQGPATNCPMGLGGFPWASFFCFFVFSNPRQLPWILPPPFFSPPNRFSIRMKERRACRRSPAPSFVRY